MEYKEIKDIKDLGTLKEKLKSFKKDHLKLRLQKSLDKLSNVMIFKETRKDIARVKTRLSQINRVTK